MAEFSSPLLASYPYSPSLDRTQVSWTDLLHPIPSLTNSLGNHHIQLANNPQEYLDTKIHRLTDEAFDERSSGSAVQLSKTVKRLHYTLGALEQIPILGNVIALLDYVASKVFLKSAYDKDILSCPAKRVHLQAIESLFRSIDFNTEGLYRSNGRKVKIEEQLRYFEQNGCFNVSELGSKEAADLVKKVLKRISPSLIPQSVYEKLKEANSEEATEEILQELPSSNKEIIKKLSAHLLEFQSVRDPQKGQQMDEQQCSKIFAIVILPEKANPMDIQKDAEIDKDVTYKILFQSDWNRIAQGRMYV